MIGQLIKITANKKLMVKIDESLFRQITAMLTDAYKRRKFEYKGDRTVFALDNENELEESAYFVLITLDKYDKLLLAKKFEPLVRKQVAIQYRMQHYDFAGDDGRVQGINLVLTNISKSRQQRETEALEAVADEAAEKAEKRVVDGIVIKTDRQPRSNKLIQMIKKKVADDVLNNEEEPVNYRRRRRVVRQDEDDEDDEQIGEVGQLSKLLDAMDEAEEARRVRDEALLECAKIEDDIAEDDVAAMS